MDITVFLVVLLAAGLHATWNAIVKTRGEKVSAMAAVSLGEAGLALVVIIMVPPPPPESWPYLAVGIALHVGYKTFLALAYRFGDLTHVYPVARGAAPLIVAVLSVAVVGEPLSLLGALAVTVIGLGIMSLALTRRSDGIWAAKPAALALLTGCFIAAYTIVDGLGARTAGSPHGFWAWLALVSSAIFIGGASLSRRCSPAALMRADLRPGIVGGVASFCAYWLVVWALTLAPMALVAALRETSILFTLLVGVVLLKERLGVLRLAATMGILAGVILLRIQG